MDEVEYQILLNQVIYRAQIQYNNRITDYNVVDDETVELLSKDGEVLHTITTEQLTKLWNDTEGSYEDYESQDWSDTDLNINQCLERMNAYLESDDGFFVVTTDTEVLFRTPETIGWRERVQDFLMEAELNEK